MSKSTDAQMILVANAIAYELNLGHADIRPYIERAAERAIAIVREEKAEIHRDSAAEIERLKQEVIRLEAIANTDTPELDMQHAEIMQLRQENERLRKEYARAYEDSEWNRLQAEIERLKQENQDLKDRFAHIAEIFTEHEKKMSKL